MISILDIHVSETNYAQATEQIQRWAQARESRAVYATSVHGTMEAHDDIEFRNILNRADLITPDGMPLVWIMRLKGVRSQQRTYGPTLMLNVLEMAADKKIPVGFYGGEPSTLEKLVKRLNTIYPSLEIDYAFSPPFRPLTDEETRQIRRNINSSEVRILFVGLVVNEAFNQGVPVIATDAVGAAAGGLIQDGYNGIIVKEKDLGELAEAMDRLISDPELHRNMSIRAKDCIQDWNYERNVQGYRDAIKYVLAKHK